MPKGVYQRVPGAVRRPLDVRFWEKVKKSDGCWLWIGAHGRYGHIWTGRLIDRAHRVSWRLAHGEIPAGMLVLHRCDVTLCVRPDHLFLGSQADNVRDMWSKGRGVVLVGDVHPARRPGARVGERNGRARLSQDDVRAIRRMRSEGAEYRVIADAFGVAVPTVQHVVSRRNWTHIK